MPNDVVETPSIVPLKIDTNSFSIEIKNEEVVKQTKTGSKTTKVPVLSLDNIEKARRLRVTTHPNGLVAELVPRYRYVYRPQEDRNIIPGQYTDIYTVARFMVLKVEINEIQKGEFVEQAVNLVAQQLETSGLWASRGKLRWRNVPEDFWKVVSIDNFAIGTVKSFYQWWLSALLKRAASKISTHNRKKWLVKANVHSDVEKGALPENINRIRYWNQLTFDDLMNFVAHSWPTKKQWGPFIMQVRTTFYESLMLKHNDWMDPDKFDVIVEYLARCPKTSRMALALNSLANSGLNAFEIVELNLITAKDAAKAADYSKKFQTIYRQNKKHLNSTYHPPVLHNIIDEKHPERNFTWQPEITWADSITFPNLSDVYDICISRYESYENKMVEGYAHTLYALDHTPKNKGGFVAYISLRNNYYNKDFTPLPPPPGEEDGIREYTQEEKIALEEAERKKHQIWYIEEMRSHSNNSVSDEHRAYVEQVVAQINKQFPGPHPVVEEITKDALVAELVADPIGAKIKTLWENRPRF